MKRREEKSITLLTNILSFKLLIALLSILLFLISCKSNENPNTPEKPPRKKHELEGTWIGYDKKDKNYKLEFKVDSDGNITFSPRPAPYGSDEFISYTYTGKIEINAIVYPYDAEVFCRLTDGGTFKFSSSSNCSAKYDRIDGGYPNSMSLTRVTVDFIKK